MEDNKVQIVIRIDLGSLILPSGLTLPNSYETISNILFGRSGYKETPKIRTLVNRLAIGTRTKMTLKEESNQDSILIFWRYDPNLTTIATFTSDLLSVYEDSDREYKRLNKDSLYLLIGTNNIRTLSAPELFYLKKQIDGYVERVKALGKVKVLCK